MILLGEQNLHTADPSGSFNIGCLLFLFFIAGVLFHYIMPALMVIMKSQNS